MKQKINALAVAVFIALTALIPAGCSNGENTASETPSQNSVSQAEETIVETSYPFNDDPEGVVAAIPSEKSDVSDIKTEEESSEASTKAQSSELHSEIEDTSSPSEPSAASDSSDIHKKTSEKAVEPTSVLEEHSESEKQNSNSKSDAQESKPASRMPEQSSASQVSTPVAAASVTLDHSSLNMTVGDKVRLTATISPADTDDMRLTWEWSDDSVIRIDSTGTVSAIGAGKATITVKTANNKSAVCTVIVKAKEVSKPTEQSSKPVESSNSDESSKNTELDPVLKPYAEPYDWDAIIDDLRSVGEKQYSMIWEDSLWVKNRGQDYGSKYDEEWGYEIVDDHYHGTCQFYFPESTRDTNNAKDFRDDCLYTFENMEKDMKQDGDDLKGARFKIVIEDVSTKYSGTEYWIYVLYT